MGVNGTRTLITGGLGFVGARLCEALVEQGAEVTVLDDESVGSVHNLEPQIADRVDVIAEDICDVEAIARRFREAEPSAVIHLAAVHFIPTCERHPTRAIAVNVAGTQAVLEASAATRSVEVVVVASSGAVYSPAPQPHHEGAPVGPTDIYGLSKEWTERIAAYFRDATGIPVGVARLFNVIGPGETNPHLLPAIIEQLGEGRELQLGNLSTRRDYVYSGDVADALVRLTDWCRSNGSLTCNVGSEASLSGDELVALVGAAAGQALPVVRDATRFRESDRPVLVSDCTRARTLLGWQATTSIEDAVAAALAQPFAVGYTPA